LPAIAGPPGCWGDFDNDGDLDLFFNGLYRNNSNISNSPPTTPFGLMATLLPNNNVLLSWTPSSDIQNSNSAGLSYAVRAGTAPGAVNLVPCNADPISGYRRPSRSWPAQH
jgi:hypothetical protein